MNINCVVVTYNRLELLKENLEALKKQTYSISKIVIIDNHSTDATKDYLELYKDDSKYIVIRTDKNIGGSGGFSLGLKESVKSGCDYTWLMDDDTIPEPDALEKLVSATELNKNVGFVCSQVNWTDGNPHIMNKPNCLGMIKSNIFECKFCSFVSVMISSEAVYKVGLPIKEFFIWCDDIEYTTRIHDAGYPCYYVPDSVVLHKTTNNYYPSIDLAPANTAWRFYYQARNTCYLKRRKQPNKLLFYISVLNKYRVYLHKLKRRTDGNKQEFIDAVKRGCIDGLKFYPEIEYIS